MPYVLYWPDWSPDGTKIAFTHMVDEDFESEIYVINANGTAPLRLTDDGAHPAWSPDGTRIAFSRERDGRRQIFVMNADGTGQQQLTTAGGSDPAWQGPSPGLWANPCDDAEPSYDDYYFDAIGPAHRETVRCVTILALVGGTTDEQGRPVYRPRATTTRGQMASFIARTLARAGVDLPDPGGDRFSDVATTVHRRNINRLAHAGIVDGTGGGRFRPSAPVSRQQMASFVVRALEYAGERDLSAQGNWFADVPRANIHFDNVSVGLEQLLWEGTTRPVDRPRSGIYSPHRHVPRGQMATFMMYMVEWLQRNEICSNPPGWCNTDRK